MARDCIGLDFHTLGQVPVVPADKCWTNGGKAATSMAWVYKVPVNLPAHERRRS
jgi:hypothetical protein